MISQAHDIWIGLPAFVTTVKDVTHLLAKFNRWNVCTGNYDQKFVNVVPLHVRISDKNTSYAANREGDMGAFDGNTRYTSTVR